MKKMTYKKGREEGAWIFTRECGVQFQRTPSQPEPFTHSPSLWIHTCQIKGIYIHWLFTLNIIIVFHFCYSDWEISCWFMCACRAKATTQTIGEKKKKNFLFPS